MSMLRYPLLALLVLAAGPALAQHDHSGHGAAAPAAGECLGDGFDCAQTATPAFGPDGKLWLAWATSDRIRVAVSGDLGRTFRGVVSPHPDALMLDNGPDERPKIAIDANGRIVVAYATRDKAYNGEVLVTQSTDGGKTFSASRKLTTGSPSQRFEALAFDPAGRLFAAWLDKRNVAAGKASGEKYDGAALAYAWADSGSVSFPPARIARDNTCECCRIGLGFAGEGRPVVLFRNIFEGSVRDHGLIAFEGPEAPGPVRRVAIDAWKTSACPHQGPSLAVSDDGSYHAAWFTTGQARKGVFYAHSSDGGATFSEPMPVGSAKSRPSRPYLLAMPGQLYLAWKEFDGEQTSLVLRASRDHGVSWDEPRRIAATKDGSDHPLLVSDGKRGYLSWLTRREGYRLFALEALL